MKTLNTHVRRRWTGLLAAAVALVAGVATMQPAAGDSTVGSLPSADGGDGNQCFYLRGPREEVKDVIVDAWGDGFYVPINLPDGEIWIEFYGEVSLTLDQPSLAANPDLQFGLSAGFNGGGMLVLLEADGEFSGRKIPVDAGFSWATPYDRIEPLLDAPLSFHTTQVETGVRAEISYTAADGLFTIFQDLK